MNYILPEIHIKLGAERWSATDDLLREYVNENTDDAVHAIVALRVQRNNLLDLLREFKKMDIPCPFRGNDGRLKDFCEWYKKVDEAIKEQP